eukprot:scaffold9199_cov61-Phaeocystis_antarctica.AAC.1
MVAAKAAATPLPSPPPRRSWPAARGHGRVRPRDVPCYVFNGLCDGASEAEELPAASITRSLNVPVLMLYVCTHSEVLAVSVIPCSRHGWPTCKIRFKGYGLKCPGWWECSLAAISQTSTHMHGHHEATMGLAGVSLGRELRALALSHTASVRRGTA